MRKSHFAMIPMPCQVTAVQRKREIKTGMLSMRDRFAHHQLRIRLILKQYGDTETHSETSPETEPTQCHSMTTITIL